MLSSSSFKRKRTLIFGLDRSITVIDMAFSLLVNPTLLSAGPARDFALAGEPQGYFLLGTIDSVGAVADVAPDIDGIVEADGARGGGERVGSTENETADLDDLTALPHHGDDWAGGHIADKTGKKRLVLQVFVMLLKVLFGGRDHLDGDEFEAALLEAANNVSNKSTLDTIRLNSNEGLLRSHFDFNNVSRS